MALPFCGGGFLTTSSVPLFSGHNRIIAAKAGSCRPYWWIINFCLTKVYYNLALYLFGGERPSGLLCIFKASYQGLGKK